MLSPHIVSNLTSTKLPLVHSDLPSSTYAFGFLIVKHYDGHIENCYAYLGKHRLARIYVFFLNYWSKVRHDDCRGLCWSQNCG